MATKTNRSDVVENFIRYHGRQPTSEQDLKTVEYLTTKAPQEVESLLAKDSPITKGILWSDYQKQLSSKEVLQPNPNIPGIKKVNETTPTSPTSIQAGITSTETKPPLTEPITGLDQGTYDKINGFIDGLGLTQTEKDFLKGTFLNKDTYTSGATVPTTEQISQWISDAATNAETDINPYYEKITSQDLEDYKNKMADIRNESLRYTQQEGASYKQQLAETKQNLRARGLTFSGINRATLGKEAAIDAAGVEGSLPGSRRMNWEDKLAGWQETARDTGLTTERKIGSATIGNEAGLASPYDLRSGNLDYIAGRTQSLYDPSQAGTAGYIAGRGGSGTMSEYELNRLRDIELAKQSKLNQYRLTL